MPTNILMPALSPTMEKGNLAKWLKKEGDKVKSGDVIAEIETDKATMEVEAVDEGTLAKIVIPAGTADVPVNQVIAVLAGEGEDVKAAFASAASAPAAQSRKRKSTPPAAAPAPKPAPQPQAAPMQPAMSAPAPAHKRQRAYSRRRSRADWRKTPASMCRASRARARMAAWSRATWKPRNPARD